MLVVCYLIYLGLAKDDTAKTAEWLDLFQWIQGGVVTVQGLWTWSEVFKKRVEDSPFFSEFHCSFTQPITSEKMWLCAIKNWRIPTWPDPAWSSKYCMVGWRLFGVALSGLSWFPLSPNITRRGWYKCSGTSHVRIARMHQFQKECGTHACNHARTDIAFLSYICKLFLIDWSSVVQKKHLRLEIASNISGCSKKCVSTCPWTIFRAVRKPIRIKRLWPKFCSPRLQPWGTLDRWPRDLGDVPVRLYIEKDMESRRCSSENYLHMVALFLNIYVIYYRRITGRPFWSVIFNEQ